MSNTNNVTRVPGIGFLGALGLIFITLKLTGFIAWSWWWVLLPIYAPLALALLFFLLAGILMAIGAAAKK